jgi:hypothetical protein
MLEPEVLLRELGEEEPPPEIALAAVRVFRYRAIAVICVLLIVGLLIAPWLHRQIVLPPPHVVGSALAADDNEVTFLQAHFREDGVHVLVWEMACDPDRMFWLRTPACYIHVMAWHDDPGTDVLLGVDHDDGGSRLEAMRLRRSEGEIVWVPTSDGQRGGWASREASVPHRDGEWFGFGEDRWVRIPAVAGQLDGELLLDWLVLDPAGHKAGTFTYQLPFTLVEEGQ